MAHVLKEKRLKLCDAPQPTESGRAEGVKVDCVFRLRRFPQRHLVVSILAGDSRPGG